MSDVERRPRRVLDQIAGRGDADEHEREPLERRVGRAILVEEPNRREEIVGEIEPQRGVDLVHEDHDALGPLDQRHFAEVAGEALRVGVIGVRVPPLGRSGVAATS